MEYRDHNRSRLIGNYILGPRIGSGSFAVVWRSRHRQSGLEVAVKEIDKKHLSQKVRESLVEEISILRTIDHPNIIRLLEAIETEDRIYLVLEYCDGGDLAGYLHRHGKVSETVARHFLRQLAAGLQVLQEKHLIHRDLKPQNLLLTNNESTPLLKIGDFDFARFLTRDGLANTVCGSPLYMAPEIIQGHKYNAKADLWSVGAILFQLVTGRPPFDGNNQLELFQNILRSNGVQFPSGVLEQLHPDCVDLCRCLLRKNPVERLTFKEFFSHKFFEGPRQMLEVELSNSSASDNKSLPVNLSRSSSSKLSSGHDNIMLRRIDGGSTSGSGNAHKLVPNIGSDGQKKSTDPEPKSSDQPQVSDSMELIEKDYVLVSAHFASMETLSYYLDSSVQVKCEKEASDSPKLNEQGRSVMQAKELASGSVGGVDSSQKHGSELLLSSSASLREVQGLSILHPSTRLQLLHQYVQIIAELSKEQYDARLYLESFSVELVILAIWERSLQICSTWLTSSTNTEIPASNLANEPILVQGGTTLSPITEEAVDFTRPSSVSSWAENSFVIAFNRAEKLSQIIREMDGTTDMPDAMEIIFQKALALGISGAVEEYMENNSTAAEAYSKALLLLSFIAGEATMLSLKPPFSLTPDNKQRIQQYITNLHSRQTNFLKSQPSLEQFLNSNTK
ncbi:hypothetical protein UlMin_021825 [Ulmus minor]